VTSPELISLKSHADSAYSKAMLRKGILIRGTPSPKAEESYGLSQERASGLLRLDA